MVTFPETIKENSARIGDMTIKINDLKDEIRMLENARSQLIKINNGIRGLMAMEGDDA